MYPKNSLNGGKFAINMAAWKRIVRASVSTYLFGYTVSILWRCVMVTLDILFVSNVAAYQFIVDKISEQMMRLDSYKIPDPHLFSCHSSLHTFSRIIRLLSDAMRLSSFLYMPDDKADIENYIGISVLSSAATLTNYFSLCIVKKLHPSYCRCRALSRIQLC